MAETGPWTKYAPAQAPTGPWTKYAAQAPAEAPAAASEQGFGPAFSASLAASPAGLGGGLEAVGEAAGLTPVQEVGRWIAERTRPGPTTYRPLEWKDVDSAEDAFTWLKEQVGTGLGSTVIPMATAATGALVGGALAGPVGATVGAVGGAAATAPLANINDAVQQFEAEGIDHKTAVKAGVMVGSLISLPDVFSFGFLTRPVTGAVKKAIQASVIRQIAGRLAEGASLEAATEGLQQSVQEAAAAYLGGTDDGLKRVERIVGSVVGGAAGGAVFGGAAGATLPRSGDVDTPADDRTLERIIMEGEGTREPAQPTEQQLALPLGEPGPTQPPAEPSEQPGQVQPPPTPPQQPQVARLAEPEQVAPPPPQPPAEQAHVRPEQARVEPEPTPPAPRTSDYVSQVWAFVKNNPLNVNATSPAFSGTPEAMQLARQSMRAQQNYVTLSQQGKHDLAAQAAQLSQLSMQKAIGLGFRFTPPAQQLPVQPQPVQPPPAPLENPPVQPGRFEILDQQDRGVASFETEEQANEYVRSLKLKGDAKYHVQDRQKESFVFTEGSNAPIRELREAAPELVGKEGALAKQDLANPNDNLFLQAYPHAAQMKEQVLVEGKGPVSEGLRTSIGRLAAGLAQKFLGNRKLIVQLGEGPIASTLAPAHFRGGQQFAFIYLSPEVLTKGNRRVLTELAHEFGHAVMWAQWASADTATQQAVYRAFLRHLERTRGQSGFRFASDFLSPMQIAKFHAETMLLWTQQTRPQALNNPTFKNWYSFDEWLAEQVNRYLLGTVERASVADRFFKGVADAIRAIFRAFVRSDGTVEAEVEQWLDRLLQRTGSTPPLSLIGSHVAFSRGVMENATALKETDIAGVAPPQTETIYMKQALASIRAPKRKGAELDQYTSWLRFWPNLLQLSEKNRHIAGLQRYTEIVREWQIKKMQIISRADGTAKDWRRLGKDQAQRLSNFMFDLDAMTYLPSGENARWPTQQELLALARKHGLSADTLQIYFRVKDDFLNILAEVQRAWEKDAERSLAGDALALAQARFDIAAEMSQLRSRPYFPHERFGDWTVTHYDAKGKVVGFWQFATAKEANAFAAVRSKQYPEDRIGAGKLAEEVKIFRGLPPTLIRQLAGKLKGLTAAQREQLDQLAFDMSPANSFAHHMQKRKGTPGFSTDGLRAYANYMLHAGNHIARLEWRQDLEDAIGEVESSARAMVGRVQAEDVGRRQGIADWLKRHFDYIMNPPNEWNAMRSFAFFWYMGLNPSSALVNMTQVPMVAWPYLAARFGDFRAQGALMRAALDLQKLYKLDPKALAADEIDAIREGIAQGFLDESQNADLAGMAQHGTLGRLIGGTKLERWRQNLTYYSSYLFQAIEKANRRVVFRAAYRLAKGDPTNKQTVELIQANRMLYQNLLAKGWSPTNAGAFLLARDAIEKSQFNYASYARPEFIRGRKGVLFAFWMFKQQMLYFFKNDPGAGRAFLVMLATAGLMGLPFAQDASDFVKYAARLFGKDFNPEQEAREAVKELAGAAGFDESNSRRLAETMMDGFGKESFGLTWAAQGLGIPFPGIDLSSRLGMGRIVPGLDPLGQGLTQEIDPQESVGRIAQEVLGASYGVPLAILRAVETGDLDEYKTWERLLPSAARNVVRAIRYAEQGGETTRSGASIAQFDVTDTEQAAEVVAQMLGFTPTRVSREWDKIAAQKEAVRYWALRRRLMFDQFDRALRSRDREAVADAKQALRRFNAEAPDKRLRITAKAIKESFAQREQARRKQERGLAQSRTYQGLSSQIGALYPE